MSKPKAKADAAPARQPTTIRGALERARHLTETTPEERLARRQSAAAVLQAVHAIGPKMIRQLQAEGTLARDGATMLRQIAAGLGAFNAHRAQQQAAQDAMDQQIAEVARQANDADVAELVAAAYAGVPGAAETVQRLEGALWRVRAKDPAFVSSMVETYGPAGAAEVLRARGVADLIPVATDTYVSAKAETWAKSVQDAAANDPTGISQSDLALMKPLRTAEYHATAARTLLRLGLGWDEAKGETPGMALSRLMRQVITTGAEARPGVFGEKALADDELASRIEEMTGGEMGDAHAIKETIQAFRAAEHEAAFLHRARKADLERAAARGKQEPTAQAKGEAARRAALEKARAQLGTKDEGEGTPTADSLLRAKIALARGEAPTVTRHGREEAERRLADLNRDAERHEHSIGGAIEKARAAMEGRQSPPPSSPAPEPSTSPEPSTPATSGGSIRESISAARAAMTGGNDGGSDAE